MKELVKVIRIEDYGDGTYQTSEMSGKAYYLDRDGTHLAVDVYTDKGESLETITCLYQEEEAILTSKSKEQSSRIYLKLNSLTDGYLKDKNVSLHLQFIARAIKSVNGNFRFDYEIYSQGTLVSRNTLKIRKYRK